METLSLDGKNFIKTDSGGTLYYNNNWYKEEIKEPSYEVLELKSASGAYSKFEETYCNYRTKNDWVRQYLEAGHWFIYSVKRLSDGEVFTVGDVVNNPKLEPFIIKEFTLSNNTIIVTSTTGGVCPSFEKLEKSKKLITTEDGIDVFENNTKFVYCVSTSLQMTTNHTLKRDLGFLNEEYKYKFFSNKKAAEDYIASQTVLFTTEDGVKVFDSKIKLWLVTNNFDLFHAWIGFKESDSSVGMYVYLPQFNKYFSTKEAADDYIFMNKPVLSLKDIDSACVEIGINVHNLNSTTIKYTKIDTQALDKLVRERI